MVLYAETKRGVQALYADNLLIFWKSFHWILCCWIGQQGCMGVFPYYLFQRLLISEWIAFHENHLISIQGFLTIFRGVKQKSKIMCALYAPTPSFSLHEEFSNPTPLMNSRYVLKFKELFQFMNGEFVKNKKLGNSSRWHGHKFNLPY